jgi:hypothetical protein
MNAPGGAGFRPDGREMFGVAQAGSIFSQPRHFHAGGGGSQSETLAQRAGESWRGGEKMIHQSEPSSGEEGRITSADSIFADPRPARKAPFHREI